MGSSPLLSPTTCRMARAAVDWTQGRLATEAHLAIGVVRDYESGRRVPRRNNLAEIVLVFQKAGVEFLTHGTRVLVLPPQPIPIAD
jgi:DNA-binding transcriptional regulator YiaG